MVLDALKFSLSAICTVPPAFCLAIGPLPSEKVNGFGGDPPALLTAAWSSASEPGISPW